MRCPFCQYEHDNHGDRYGCPNCHGEGLNMEINISKERKPLLVRLITNAATGKRVGTIRRIPAVKQHLVTIDGARFKGKLGNRTVERNCKSFGNARDAIKFVKQHFQGEQ